MLIALAVTDGIAVLLIVAVTSVGTRGTVITALIISITRTANQPLFPNDLMSQTWGRVNVAIQLALLSGVKGP